MTLYRRNRYLYMAQDPIHIGTGGYRLGRVDNSIVREPGSHIPKIPGTSLHGAVRSYAARLYVNLDAAGQKQDDVPDPTRDPICYTFGFTKVSGRGSNDEETIAYSGVINIFDALVLLFPVYSLHGPVWVSTPDRLKQAGASVDGVPTNWAADQVLPTWEQHDPLNLGWLMLRSGPQVSVSLPEPWRNEAWSQIKDRLVLVSPALFSQVVNSNLEVRTSVSINPHTGAAEEGALFTYEALPRATLLTGDVVLDDYRNDPDGIFDPPITETRLSNPLPGAGWDGPLAVFESGLRLVEWLGVGGMGTRGFGRLAIVGDPLILEYGSA